MVKRKKQPSWAQHLMANTRYMVRAKKRYGRDKKLIIPNDVVKYERKKGIPTKKRIRRSFKGKI